MNHATVKLLITIVDRGKGQAAADLLTREGVLRHYIMLGNGTAHKDLLGLLGLRDTAKDVLLSFVPADSARAFSRLYHALDIDLPGKGIAFTVSISSVGGPGALSYLTGGQAPAKAQEEEAMSEHTHDLVIAIVNRGYTDAVMDAARPAGAMGGTVLHARGAGTQEAAQFLGITIQPEKELVMILVDSESKVAVMQAIVKGAGLSSEGKGLVFSLPAGDVMGIARSAQKAEEDA